MDEDESRADVGPLHLCGSELTRGETALEFVYVDEREEDDCL